MWVCVLIEAFDTTRACREVTHQALAAVRLRTRSILGADMMRTRHRDDVDVQDIVRYLIEYRGMFFARSIVTKPQFPSVCPMTVSLVRASSINNCDLYR